MKVTVSRFAAVLLVASMFLLSAPMAWSQDPGKIFSEDEVTLEALKAIFEAAYFDASYDQDGDLMIQEDGMKTFIRVDAERKIVSYFNIWAMRDDVSELKKLQFINSLNDGLIIVRFSMTDQGRLLCDYQFDFEGGIKATTFVNYYRSFAKVVRGAVTDRDPDGIIGD